MAQNIELNSSKTLVLLRQLDKKELKQLGLWLQSPVHNKSEKVIQLYECIKSKYLKKENTINAYVLLKTIGVLQSASRQNNITPHHKKQLQQTMHLLNTQIQDFLMWQYIRTDDIRAMQNTMDAMFVKKIYAFIPPLLHKTKTDLMASPIRNILHYERALDLTELDYFLQNIYQNRSLDSGLQLVIENLRQAFLSKSLLYYCVAINREKILKVGYEYPFLKYIKSYLEVSDVDTEVPPIRVYYTLLKLLEAGNTKDYYDLKNYLFTHLDCFELTDIRYLFNFISNYTIGKVREGKHEFVQERFDLFDKGIELKCWTSGIYFSEHQFVHVVKTALELGKMDWLNTFFQTHKDLLNPNVKDVFVNYYHALVSFHDHKFDKAQAYLGGIHTSEDFTYFIQFKILYIKIYYDKNDITFSNVDTHQINYEMEALRQYLLEGNNKNMAESTRLLYSNFTNFFRRILNRKKKLLYDESVTKTNFQSLQQDLAEIAPLIERSWLEEKIEELVLLTE